MLTLHSLSAREYEAWSGKTLDRVAIAEWMLRGGYPEVHSRNLDAERFFGDYLATYLERDVRSILGVRSLRDFDGFMRLCAARSGQLVSYAALATDLGVSPNTVKSWLSVLNASIIVLLLEPYFENRGKRIVKTPNLYFLDTGLCSYLLGARSPDGCAAGVDQVRASHRARSLLSKCNSVWHAPPSGSKPNSYRGFSRAFGSSSSTNSRNRRMSGVIARFSTTRALTSCCGRG